MCADEEIIYYGVTINRDETNIQIYMGPKFNGKKLSNMITYIVNFYSLNTFVVPKKIIISKYESLN